MGTVKRYMNWTQWFESLMCLTNLFLYHRNFTISLKNLLKTTQSF
jgi:hypothetical protein